MTDSKSSIIWETGKEYDNEGFRIDIPLNDEERCMAWEMKHENDNET